MALEGVTKRWRDLMVLDRVDLRLGAGRVAWLGGDNGVGKTTLLRVASGLILPEAGRVHLDGLSPDADRRRFHARLGFLTAGDRGLYARLTVRQNLAFAAGLALLDRGEERSLVDAAVERFGLGDLAGRRVDRMSMGQRHRARLAATFLHDPDVVLLDEPRTSLDSAGIDLLCAAVENLRARGGCALWCSPAVDEPPLDVDDRYVLAGGAVVPC